MSVRQRLAASVHLTVFTASVAMAMSLLTTSSSALMAQGPVGGGVRSADAVPQPEPEREAEPVYEPPFDQAPKRYDEPYPPPADFWQPTWMPCQSLRTNRSLVLGHMYFGMDILGWATKGVQAPALVTTSSLGDGGILGEGDTSVLSGDEFIHNEMRPGGKLTIGWWFDPNQTSGVEWHYLELDGKRIRFDAFDDTGDLVIARPIIDGGSGDNGAVITASDEQNGSIRVASKLQVTSTGVLFRDLFYGTQFARVDYLVGYRHAMVRDRLRTDESIVALVDGNFTADDVVTRVDKFQTINQFDGADLGMKFWWSKGGKLALTGLGKIAVGAINNNVIIDGFTSIDSGGTVTTTDGGVLTQPSNIGRRAEQRFGIVSEVGLGLEWEPACQFKFNLGYTWLYWSRVARAVNQIDTTVDVDQLAPNNGSGSRPEFNPHTTSFWAQGLTGGFTYQF
jgi:hypothetical protein